MNKDAIDKEVMEVALKPDFHRTHVYLWSIITPRNSCACISTNLIHKKDKTFSCFSCEDLALQDERNYGGFDQKRLSL